jgi:hypothetical protein
VFLDVGQGDGAVLITSETGAREGVIVIAKLGIKRAIRK